MGWTAVWFPLLDHRLACTRVDPCGSSFGDQKGNQGLQPRNVMDLLRCHGCPIATPDTSGHLGGSRLRRPWRLVCAPLIASPGLEALRFTAATARRRHTEAP